MISVIVPVYNMEKYLPACLDSILGQSFQELEVIIVDDGSKDGSPLICDQYAGMDSRVQVIHKENGGQGSARNRALDIAKGEYIGFIDSDDWIAPDMYESLLETARQYQADITICETVAVYEDGRKEVHRRHNGLLQMDRKTAMLHSLDDTAICSHSPCNKLYRRELFEGLRFLEDRLLEDSALMYRLIDRAHTVVYTDRVGYYIRCDSGSVSRRGYNARRCDTILTFEEMEEFLRNSSEYRNLTHYATDSKLGAVFYNAGELAASSLQDKKLVQKRLGAKSAQYRKEHAAKSVKQKALLWMIQYMPGLYGAIYRVTKQ